MDINQPPMWVLLLFQAAPFRFPGAIVSAIETMRSVGGGDRIQSIQIGATRDDIRLYDLAKQGVRVMPSALQLRGIVRDVVVFATSEEDMVVRRGGALARLHRVPMYRWSGQRGVLPPSSLRDMPMYQPKDRFTESTDLFGSRILILEKREREHKISTFFTTSQNTRPARPVRIHVAPRVDPPRVRNPPSEGIAAVFWGGFDDSP